MLSETLTNRLFSGLSTAPEEKRQWLQRAFQQLNKDLSLSGLPFIIPDHDDPALRLEALARWLQDVSPAQLKQLLYCIDLPESLNPTSSHELAHLCVRRALLKVWTRYHSRLVSDTPSDMF
ncbi:MAG: hypothetical protein N2110_05900 [Flavobacteriales bacterium]|nr:hypothetical protein [Flavobacteriales bacterium]MCX7768537.1 hypothetical protein [Flavobacteriales bacterium]MDW8410217.1 hypothetical protein [Flavobacteriales bacterium]